MLSEYCFRTCKQRAIVSGHRRTELLASSNLMNALLAEGGHETARLVHRDVHRALVTLAEVLGDDRALTELVGDAQEAAARLKAVSHLPSNAIVDLLELEPPQRTGTATVAAMLAAGVFGTEAEAAITQLVPGGQGADIEALAPYLPVITTEVGTLGCIPE